MQVFLVELAINAQARCTYHLKSTKKQARSHGFL